MTWRVSPMVLRTVLNCCFVVGGALTLASSNIAGGFPLPLGEGQGEGLGTPDNLSECPHPSPLPEGEGASLGEQPASSVTALAVSLNASDPIAPDQFGELHALIKPKPSEQKWLDIPWMASLWEARQRAAAEGKPILLWEMDGHPLGCT